MAERSTAWDAGNPRLKPFQALLDGLQMQSDCLIFLHANEATSFTAELDLLESAIAQGASLSELSRESARRSPADAQGLTLSLIGKDSEALLSEINHARRGIPRAMANQTDWQTPAGSFFTSKPIGLTGKIAFVYPGAFSSYPGMGRELFATFPEVLEHLLTITSDPWSALQGDRLYPSGLDQLSPSEFAILESRLAADPVAMLFSGTTLAIALTWVLRSIYKLSPHHAFGYSLGESSMLFSLGIWCDGDQSMQTLASSQVFQTRLAGTRQAVREYWDGNASDTDPAAWENHILMAPPQSVAEIVDTFDHVYLTHINAPRQVVIGGEPEECRQVIGRLGCASLRAPFDHVLHCPPVFSEIPDLEQMNDWPVISDPGISLLSADQYLPLVMDRKHIAASIARMLCHPLDFPRLINQAYDDGARVFVEVGAGSNCSRWVDETLSQRPHLAVASNRRGSPDRQVFLKMVARLASHQVPVDLSRITS